MIFNNSYKMKDVSNFIKEYWDYSPTVLRQPLALPIATHQEIFEGLLFAVNQYIEDCDKPTNIPTKYRSTESERRWIDIRFFTGNYRIMGDIIEYLPTAQDKDIAGYQKRMDSLFKKEGYFLYITNFHCNVPVIWQRVCSFLSNIYPHVGYPANFADLELFMGNYKVTPGGIHRDKGASFQFIIEGTKTMYVWPRQQLYPDKTSEDFGNVLNTNIEKMNISKYKKHSVELTGTPGDILYWGPNHWHAGASETFSVSLTLALYMSGTANPLVEKAISQIIGSNIIDSLAPKLSVEDNLAFPSEIEQKSSALLSAFNEKKFPDKFYASWLSYLTAYGFKYIPYKRQEMDIHNSKAFNRIASIPISWFVKSQTLLIIGCNGHIWESTNNMSVIQILHYLNDNIYIDVQELINNYCKQPGEIEYLYLLLNNLYKYRWIDEINQKF